MANRKRIDTSGMFLSMTGHKEPEAEQEAVVTKPADVQAAPRKPAAQKRKAERTRIGWVNEQTEKKTFYLTPRNYIALRLRNSRTAGSTRQISSIVNEALEKYLVRELAAMDQIGYECSEQELYERALTIIVSES